MRRTESEENSGGVIRTVGGNIRWPILLLCCWAITQCALRPIPRDLAVYVNRDVGGITGLEEVGLKRYAELTGKNFASDQALRQALETEIIPAYKRFADLAGAIKPQTDPVRRLHALYHQAAVLRLQGFRTILLAIDSKDSDLVRQANSLLERSQRLITQWQAMLDRMAGQYGLERY